MIIYQLTNKLLIKKLEKLPKNMKISFCYLLGTNRKGNLLESYVPVTRVVIEKDYNDENRIVLRSEIDII